MVGHELPPRLGNVSKCRYRRNGSIGQATPISHGFGRYGLGLRDKSLYESTTSINRWRMIRVISMKVSKGLEFPVVALPGVGHMPAAGEDEQEAARVFYVAATRATQRLVIGVRGSAAFGKTVLNTGTIALPEVI